jgi:hypothetical protein
MTDPFDLDNLRLPPEKEVRRATPRKLQERRVTPRKLQKRSEQFIMMPFSWFDRLKGASGQTYRVALSLLYLAWKAEGGPVKLANGMLAIDGVSPASKWRALADLENLGLVAVERRPGKSPLVRLVSERG